MTLRFLSRGEIADHLGVTLGTVKQYANFPEPDVIVGRNQGWAVETVDRWQRARLQRGEQPGRRPAPVPAASSVVPERAGAVRQDLRTRTDDSSGREPASLGAAPGSGARTERSKRLGDPAISLDRRGVDRRSRGV